MSAPGKTCFHLRHAPLGFDSAHPWAGEVGLRPAAGTRFDPAAAYQPPPPRRTAPRLVSWLAALLLLLYAVMAWTASLQHGVSFDEGLQLGVGYNIWLHGDFRIEGGNGDLIKRWATLPFLISRPAFSPGPDPRSRPPSGYELGTRLLFAAGNQPEGLLRQGRAMVVLLGLATGLLVYRAARALFGAGGGLVALTLFVFSPEMLAFGGIVSTDMSITLTLFAATWGIWRLLERVTWRRLVVSVGAVALPVLAKASGLVILPVALVLVAVRLAGGRPLRLALGRREREVAGRGRAALVLAALGCLHALAAWGAIWAHYDFRYASGPAGAGRAIDLPAPAAYDAVPGPWRWTVEALKHARWLPEGFCNGVQGLLGDDDRLGSFMRGEWRIGGRLEFFPYAIWVKTHPALFLLLGLGGWAWWRQRGGTAPALAAATPHFALVGCYLAVALTEDINIGHRHVLPVYPALYVLCGGVALAAGRRGGWPMVASAGFLAWLACDSVRVRPHYLAYFGPQVGGAARGYQHLVDSSLDWGMGLPGLKTWLDRTNPDGRVPVFLAYFGNDDPDHYGIRCRKLPGFFDQRAIADYRLTPGYYVLSASLLQSVYTAAFGPWNSAYERLYQAARTNVLRLRRASGTPAGRARLRQLEPGARLRLAQELDLFDNLRFARLCAWLRRRGGSPEQIDPSLLAWKLDHAAIRAIVDGPPVELIEEAANINVRRLRQLTTGGR